MCDFAAPWFGASYPDSFCEDGYLYDADADGYDPDDHSHACPKCNTKRFMEDAFSDAQEISWQGHGTGCMFVKVDSHDIWRNACAWALKFNPADAPAIIAKLGTPAFACDVEDTANV